MDDMEWLSSILCIDMPPNSINFAKYLQQGARLLLPNSAQKVAWLGADGNGNSGAGLTLHHHSLDTYGGHGMVQQHLALVHASKQHPLYP